MVIRTTFFTSLALLSFMVSCCGYANANSLADDIANIHARRIGAIISSTYFPDLANKWRNELTSEGEWTDVDYTQGCDASRAEWKAPEHFHRIITMSSLWSQEESDVDLLNKINMAMDHWFDNDFTEEDCINAGSVDRLTCPCGTPGFWNPNWWYQMILMPRIVGNACLLLKSVLTESRLNMCINQTRRSYDRIDGDPNGMMGGMTGANLLDVTYVGVSLGLLTEDQSLLLDALSRSYKESELTYGPEDGIKVDGSFMQHTGQLLTGSYGSVFISNMLNTFMETETSSLEPPTSVQSAFLTLISGSEWFIYRKNDTEDEYSPILLWEMSVVGRSISHKYSDWKGIEVDLNQLTNATQTWTNHSSFQEIVGRLASSVQSVNPGGLVGTRYFHVTDYLVHRGTNYIVTLKMFSQRTTNSECYNAQNPYGFHLSDGSIFTYLDGNEYTDVAGAWDWYLIPGTTIDYGATNLSCSQVEWKGKEEFVGGVAFAEAGIAAMTYTNPATGSLSWTKTYFFVPNAYVVQFVSIRTNQTAPNVLTVLDQRQLEGWVYIDGKVMEGTQVRQTARTLWHDRVGYEFLNPVNLTVDTNPRQSDWSDIGTSYGNETQNLMAAFFETHERSNYDTLTYMAHLDVSQSQFQSRSNSKLKIVHGYDNGIEQDTIVRGITFGEVGDEDRIVSLVFLTAGAYVTGLEDISLVETDAALLLLFQCRENNEGWKLAVADPSQALSNAVLRVTLGTNQEPILISVELPRGAWAGSMSLHEF